jgi:hypothetical protein
MPAAIGASEGMHFIDDDHSHALEQRPVVDAARDEHRLQGFRRREQNVGWVVQNPLACARADVTVPQRHCATKPLAVLLESGKQVVDERLQRGDVDHAQPAPVLVHHARQGGEDGRLGLPSGRRCH